MKGGTTIFFTDGRDRKIEEIMQNRKEHLEKKAEKKQKCDCVYKIEGLCTVCYKKIFRK